MPSSDKSSEKHNYRSSKKKAKVRKSDDGYLILEDNDVPLAKPEQTGEDSYIKVYIIIAAAAITAVLLAVFSARKKKGIRDKA